MTTENDKLELKFDTIEFNNEFGKLSFKHGNVEVYHMYVGSIRETDTLVIKKFDGSLSATLTRN